MPKHLFLTLGAVVGLVACSAVAHPNVSAASSPPNARPVARQVVAQQVADQRASCALHARSTKNGVAIEAVAQAGARPLTGEYNLVITKHGRAGSSDITQNGPVSAAAGEAVTLGSSEIGLDGGRYEAKLTLLDQSRAVICARTAKP